MRKPFVDDVNNNFFGENGYLLVRNFFTEEEINILKIDRSESYISFRDRYYTTLDTPDMALKSDAINKIRGVVSAKLSCLFDAYRPVITSYVIKKSNSNESLKLHQNPTFVDERFFSSIVCWIPMQSVDSSNGAMIVIPGSHRLFMNYRTANFLEEKLFDGISKKIISKYSITLDMNAGDLLLLDDALLHGSHGNKTNQDRVAATQVLIPQEASLLYFHNGSMINTLYEVDDAFYERMSTIVDLKLEILNLQPIKNVPSKKTKVDFSLFEKLIDLNRR